ncbi:MAG: AAA family ATPase [Cyclobacteriaceae bacterium]
MDPLFESFTKILRGLDTAFIRYLHNQIDWTDRLIAIKGGRGTGKTTLMLQHIRDHIKTGPHVLYVSLDELYFTSNSLVNLADDFVKGGGKFLFLDEVHKYPTWSREIKNLYDTYRELKIVFTGSSMLEIAKGDADLSRRAVVYEITGLSFREFLAIENSLKVPVLKFNDILSNHTAIAEEVVKKIKPLPAFKNYLRFGYYPYYQENKNNYHQRLATTINLVIESDLPSIERVDYSTIQKLKKLLYVVSTSVPFKPNIQKLSEQIHATRGSTLLYLDYLKNAQLLNLLRSETEGISYMNKPDKIYLNNTNLLYALAPDYANTGTLRETFFYNQLKQIAKITSSDKGDFKIDGKIVAEVGGKNKTGEQIKGIAKSFIAADEIEIGLRNKIPLWLFGFLY